MNSIAGSEDNEQVVKILIAENEPLLAQMLGVALDYENFAVLTAQDGIEALQKSSQSKPELIILDSELRGVNGIEVTRRLRATSDVGILLLTAEGHDEQQVAGLDSGADDYLIKPFTAPVLLARVRAILRRKGINLHTTLRVADVTLNRISRKVMRGGRDIALTQREFDLLEMLMAHPRQVFSREAIINRVWGYGYFGASNVVDVYIRYLRAKLHDKKHTLIKSVRGVGYSLETEQ